VTDRTYRALLVDYGGVLTTPVAESFAIFCQETGVNPERIRAVLASAYTGGLDERERWGLADLVPAVETGRMSLEDFNGALATVLSEGMAQPLEALDLASRMFGHAVRDDRMIRAVKGAQEHGIRTGLISNTWGVPEPSPWYSETFGTVVLSGREGIRKPQAEIYLLAAKRLDVDPAAAVFVDDIPANVDGARAVGMTAILHRHPDITIPKLEELFGLDLG